MAAAAVAYGIQAGASIIGGLFGNRAARKKAKAARAMAEYNASIIRANAKAEASAIEATSKKLTKQQRELMSQQRMSIYSRGGRMSGGDLLSVLNEAKEMQLDTLELQRQRDIALISGENAANQAIYSGQIQSQMAKAEGRAALISGAIGAAGSIAAGYAVGAFGGKRAKPITIDQSADPFATINRQAVNQLQTRPTSFSPSAFSMQMPDFSTGFIAPRSMVPSSLQFGGSSMQMPDFSTGFIAPQSMVPSSLQLGGR